MLIYVMGADARRQRVASFDLSWNVHVELLKFLQLCTCLQMIEKAP